MGEELSLKESFSDTGYFLKWFAVLLVMGSSNIILHRKYGDMKDDFFNINLSRKFINPQRLMFIYTLIIFIIIYSIREWTRLTDYGAGAENIEGTLDFVIYIIISLFTFIFTSAYIRRKFSKGKVSSGGGNEGGILKDTVSKISSTEFGTLAIYMGLLIIILNVMTNIFQYLKNKQTNKQDKVLRAIYFGQISTLFQLLIMGLFILGFGIDILKNPTWSWKTGSPIIRWILVIVFVIYGLVSITNETGKSLFGDN